MKNKIEEEIRKGDHIELPNYSCMVNNTFETDFKIGLACNGVGGVRDTYKRAFNEWKDDIRYLTAMVLALNWLGGEYYERENTEVAKVFYELQQELDQYILDCEYVGEKEVFKHFNKEEVGYYLRATD